MLFRESSSRRDRDQDLQERIHIMASVEVMPERAGLDRVAVPSPDPDTGEIPGRVQVRHDLLGSPFGDTDLDGDLAKGVVRSPGDGNQNMPVVGQEHPRSAITRHLAGLSRLHSRTRVRHLRYVTRYAARMCCCPGRLRGLLDRSEIAT